MKRLVVALVLGCSSTPGQLAESPHTPSELLEVPFAPPTIRSDMVPPSPHANSVWIEGEWRWQGSRWAWRRGDWVVPPPGATFARSETRREGARFRHAVAVLHLEDGSSVAPSDLSERRRKVPVEACTSPPASSSHPAVAPGTP